MSQPGPGDVRALVHCAGYAVADMGSRISATIPGTSLLDFSEVGGSNVDLEQYPSLFKGKQDLVEVFTDASWADDKRTRGSTTGAVIAVNANPVFWFSRTQKSIATSSAENEFIAAASGLQEGIYIQRLLWDELQDHALNGELEPDLTQATSVGSQD